MKTIPPEERLLTAMAQFILHINNLQTFYGTTTDALEIGKDQVGQKILKATKVGIATPEIQEIVGAEKCNTILQNEPFLNFFMKSFANRSVRLSKQMVGSSALVFAHTILDELLTECCYISFDAMPADWYSLVDDRKIEVRQLRATDTQALIHQKALELVSAPKLNGEKPITALISLDELEAFDQTRHKIIHGQPFAHNISDIEGKILFAACVGLTALALVGKTYNLFDKGNFTKDAILNKAFSGIQNDLPEVKELFSTLEKLTESFKQTTEQLRAIQAQLKR
jgi:hypothetical protein